MNSPLPTIPLILAQHAENLAFLWLLRSTAVSAPHYSLADLARLDARIDAHLDGLLVAGEAGWQVCADELGWSESGEVFAASAIAYASDDISRMQPILVAVQSDPELVRAMVGALGFLPHKQVMGRIVQLAGSHSPDLQFVGLSASAIHRIDPGALLNQSLESDKPRLRSRARRAAGELARRDLMPLLRVSLKDTDSTARFWAAWSLGLLGDHGVVESLREFAVTEFTRSIDALHLVSRLADVTSSNSWRMRLAGDAATKRHAVIAAGTIGDPAAIPWLLELMSDARLARVAGESFTTITGADLALLKLDISPPQSAESVANDDAGDENVAMDPDENLPWPNVELIQNWWSSNARRFVSGNRYLLGGVIGPDTLPLVLRDGKQRHRAAAAMELMLADPKGTTPLFEVRANARDQKQALGINAR